MGQIQVPDTIDGITPQWLGQAIADRFPSAVVRSVEIDKVLHGTATKVRLAVDYEDSGDAAPRTMWFKGGLEGHSMTPDMLIVYASEAGFYRDIAPSSGLHVPEAYAATVDPTTNHSYLLLEDLLERGATFPHISKPISGDVATAFVDQLAFLHSRHWHDPDIRSLPWLGSGGSLYQSCEVLIQEETWNRCIALPRGAFVRGPLADFPTFRREILGILKSDLSQPTCFVHGDGHIGNTFVVADGSVGFLDWQSTMFGHWAHDLSYFLVTALSIEDRRHLERDLVAHYVAKMKSLGAEIDPDQAWTAYRRHMIYPCSWTMCLPEWQTEETCCLVTEKAMTALEDLDALSIS